MIVFVNGVYVWVLHGRNERQEANRLFKKVKEETNVDKSK